MFGWSYDFMINAVTAGGRVPGIIFQSGLILVFMIIYVV